MQKRVNDVLGITRQQLGKLRAFNAILDLDSKFHVDPHLLISAKTPEAQRAYHSVRKHFEQIIKLLSTSKKRGDVFWRRAVSMLRFKEITFTGLGYSKKGTQGSGIGFETAENIADTATQIIRAGITDPEIFEIVGLLEEGVGADRISDMVVSIASTEFLEFTERVTKAVLKDRKLETIELRFREKTYVVPRNPLNGHPIILLPREVLRNLPVAEDWEDIDIVCKYNSDIRDRVNKLIGRTWKKATTRISKRDLKRALLENPGALRDLIEQYKQKPPIPYDFDSDYEGLHNYDLVGQEVARDFPLNLIGAPLSNLQDVFTIVLKICEHFKHLVENNGLYQLLYNDQTGVRKKENAIQLLFYGIADAYCAANNIELAREVNTGRGSVDFRISSGYTTRVNVEMKYSDNPKLERGYTQQLPAYNTAGRTEESVYLVVRTTKSDTKIKRINKIANDAKANGMKVPEIIVVDGRPITTASKL